MRNYNFEAELKKAQEERAAAAAAMKNGNNKSSSNKIAEEKYKEFVLDKKDEYTGEYGEESFFVQVNEPVLINALNPLRNVLTMGTLTVRSRFDRKIIKDFSIKKEKLCKFGENVLGTLRVWYKDELASSKTKHMELKNCFSMQFSTRSGNGKTMLHIRIPTEDAENFYELEFFIREVPIKV